MNHNFMGYSGRFFAYNHKVYDLDGSQKVAFENLYNPMQHYLNGVDLKGYKYEFGERASTVTYVEPFYISSAQKTWDYSLTFLSALTSIPSATCWLTKIVSPSSKDSISFDYIEESVKYKNTTGGIRTSRQRIGHYSDNFDDAYTRQPELATYMIHSTDSRLSEIIASNGIKIEFIAGIDRDDLLGRYSPYKPKALSEIRIYSPIGNLIKKWIFEYDYFYSNTHHPADSSADIRLKLKSIKEFGLGSVDSRKYIFS